MIQDSSSLQISISASIVSCLVPRDASTGDDRSLGAVTLDQNSLFEHIPQTARAFVIVCSPFHDHLMGFTSAVDVRDLADSGCSRHLLAGEKIVLE
jgi:hypothetical protein